MLRVNDLFYSIQGEGPFSGMPAVFIRLAGCNLNCVFCDTQHEKINFEIEPNDLAYSAECQLPSAYINKPDKKLAVITGGEPLMQDIGELVKCLFREGFAIVQVETNGTYWQDCLTWDNVYTVISPKTSSVHPRFAVEGAKIAWKYIIDGPADNTDGLPCESTQPGHKGGVPARPLSPHNAVFLQPCDENAENTQECVKMCMRFGYRLSLQIHKIVGIA